MSSKLEARLRSAEARAFDVLIEAMGDGLGTIRPGEVPGWFRNSAYQAQKSSDTLSRKPL